MVGLIHFVLFDLIRSAAGPQVLAEVKLRAGIAPDHEYRIDEPYDDLEWQRLLAATCEVLQIDQAKAEELYAEHFCRDSQQRWPSWFAMSKTAREFLERQPVIHNGFATGVRDPAASQKIKDKFTIDKLDDEIIVHYRSPNRLCGLYMALAREVFRYYGEEAEISQSQCQKNGDPECEIHVLWPSQAVTAGARGSHARETDG